MAKCLRITFILRKALLVSCLWVSVAQGSLVCQDLFTEALNPARGETAYEVFGKNNAETIVFVHGMGGGKEAFEDIVPYLAKHYRVVVYDQRGHGDSLAKGEDYSTKTLSRDLKALVDHLKIQKFQLVGLSMGGRVAARFTTLYPEMVQKLVIEDMDLIKRAKTGAKYDQRAILKAREVERRLAVRQYRSLLELEDALSPFLNASDLKGLMESAERKRDGTFGIPGKFSPDVYIRYWQQANRDEGLLENLAAMKVPTLMVRADAQRFWSAMTDEGVRKTKEYFPQAPVVRVIGASHIVHVEKPREFLTLIDGFFQTGRVVEPRGEQSWVQE